jgi:hypothetical protein
MTNPHVETAQFLVARVTEERMQAVAWQEILVTLMHAQVEATLAIAVELRGLRERGEP